MDLTLLEKEESVSFKKGKIYLTFFGGDIWRQICRREESVSTKKKAKSISPQPNEVQLGFVWQAPATGENEDNDVE